MMYDFQIKARKLLEEIDAKLKKDKDPVEKEIIKLAVKIKEKHPSKSYIASKIKANRIFLRSLRKELRSCA